MLDALRTYLSRIDHRPVEQIDRDIDDELNAHIAELEGELVRSGLDPAAARKEAISRFGNPQTHKRRCRDVALMERRMKTYVQMIVTVVCGLLLGAVTTMVWFNQLSANAALASMSQRMDTLSSALNARATTAPAERTSSSVYVTGSPVGRPGAYTLPAGGLSLRRLMITAGVDVATVDSVDLRHKDENGRASGRGIDGADLRNPAGVDVELIPGDMIIVNPRSR